MTSRFSHSESGNILFMILIAVALIGLLTAAIQNSNRPEGAGIDKESLILRASEIQRYASELERAVLYIMQNGKSESDIRFAHPNAHTDYGDLSADADPSDQVFHRQGGAAQYRVPPADINDGSAWAFFGNTHLPGVGSDRADLIAVLPNVTTAFCQKINNLNDQSGTPADTGTCLGTDDAMRFDDGVQFSGSPNTVDETSFEQDPSISAAYTTTQACVTCDDDSRHFYHVILAR